MTLPTVAKPAPTADCTPGTVSSIASPSSLLIPSASAANRYTAGSGLLVGSGS